LQRPHRIVPQAVVQECRTVRQGWPAALGDFGFGGGSAGLVGANLSGGGTHSLA
jgi:hypothetical protein